MIPLLPENPNTMLNIVLFGPPGAGKGTQSELLIERYHLIHISTGDLFRKNMKDGTELGLKARAYIDAGNLVPDEVVIGMVDQFISRAGDSRGFIFDGYPRTTKQAEALDEQLEKLGHPISGMLALTVPDDELRTRLTLRAETSGRSDDQDPAKIDNRIKVYYNETQPVIEFYKAQGKYIEIYGIGTIESIFNSICAEVDKL